MNTSPLIAKIAPALLEAQKHTGAAKKDAKNPFFHSTYADLGSVMEACKEALNTAGISVFQPVCGDVVKTRLVHESGEWIESEGTRIISKQPNDAQAQGSAITYARRYDLQSLVFIPAEDDDGNAATKAAPAAPKAVKAASSAKKELWCAVHKVPMQFSKKGTTYHLDKVRGFCNGEGYADEMKAKKAPPRSDDEYMEALTGS
jgi:hypothetical protein